MWQTTKNSRWAIAVGTVAAALIIAGRIIFCQQAAEVEGRNHVFEFNSVEQRYRPYALLAAEQFAEKQGMSSIDRAMTGRKVSIKRSKGEICVILVVISPGMGEAPIYCYDEATSRLTRKFDDVE